VTATDARERLLNLFPANAIRSAFSLGNVTKEKAVEQLVKSASMQAVNGFAFKFFPITKQHVYLFSPSAKLDPAAQPWELRTESFWRTAMSCDAWRA
jgi:hypothetical protein